LINIDNKGSNNHKN